MILWQSCSGYCDLDKNTTGRDREMSKEFNLKPLAQEAVPRALSKAERYRLLNEPGEAESICLDALEADPDNQEALVTMVLALTDQFDDDATKTLGEAWACVGRIRGEYD